MRKLLVILILILQVGIISGCIKEQQSPIEKALKQVATADNYEVLISFSEGEENYAITLKFAGDITYFKFNSEEEYYNSRNNRMYTYYLENGVWQESSERLNKNEKYSFITKLAAEDFIYDENIDSYLLSYGAEGPVNDFIQTVITGGTCANFAVKLVNEMISSVNFDIKVDGQTYPVTMGYSNYGNVVLTLPV